LGLRRRFLLKIAVDAGSGSGVGGWMMLLGRGFKTDVIGTGEDLSGQLEVWLVVVILLCKKMLQ